MAIQTVETTLGRFAGSDGTPAAIADYAVKQARIAEEATEGRAQRHCQALRTFAEFIRSRGLREPRIYALWALISSQGDASDYRPGEEQISLFARLGTDRPAPLPETTLNELVSAGVDDLLAHKGKEAAQLKVERDDALAKQAAAEAAKAEADVDAAELQQLRDERDQAQASSATLSEQLDHLRAMLQGGATEEAKANKPRRIRIDGHTGVYAKPTPEGELPPEGERVYEIGFPDADGKTRWKTVGSDLDEAIALRKELAGKRTYEPEAVTA